MPFCRECGGMVKTHWSFCPNCGVRTEVPGQRKEGSACQKDAPLMVATPRASLMGFSGPGPSYGSGVRAQVFEVIVRQAIAGAPWKEICAGPMQVNNIDPREVQEEVDRRREMLKRGDPKKPSKPGKNPKDAEKEKNHRQKKTGQENDDAGDHNSGWQPAPVPKKPIELSAENDARLKEPPPQNSENDRGREEI